MYDLLSLHFKDQFGKITSVKQRRDVIWEFLKIKKIDKVVLVSQKPQVAERYSRLFARSDFIIIDLMLDKKSSKVNASVADAITNGSDKFLILMSEDSFTKIEMNGILPWVVFTSIPTDKSILDTKFVKNNVDNILFVTDIAQKSQLSNLATDLDLKLNIIEVEPIVQPNAEEDVISIIEKSEINGGSSENLLNSTKEKRPQSKKSKKVTTKTNNQESEVAQDVDPDNKVVAESQPKPKPKTKQKNRKDKIVADEQLKETQKNEEKNEIKAEKVKTKISEPEIEEDYIEKSLIIVKELESIIDDVRSLGNSNNSDSNYSSANNKENGNVIDSNNDVIEVDSTKQVRKVRQNRHSKAVAKSALDFSNGHESTQKSNLGIWNVKIINQPKVARDSNGKVIGMGDFVPAFMLREVVPKSK